MCGTDGKICVDFLAQVPWWVSRGAAKAKAEQMKRLSIVMRTLSSTSRGGANNAHEKAKDSANHLLPHPVEHGKNSASNVRSTASTHSPRRESNTLDV